MTIKKITLSVAAIVSGSVLFTAPASAQMWPFPVVVNAAPVFMPPPPPRFIVRQQPIFVPEPIYVPQAPIVIDQPVIVRQPVVIPY